MDRESIEKMVLEAKGEINQIERQIVALTARRNLLWRFVTSSRELIESEAGSVGRRDMVHANAIVESVPALKKTLVAPTASSVSLPASRIWEAVHLVMGIAKRPVTVPEIIALLEKHKIIVGGDHPSENIRSAINRKDDVFEKLDRRGFYALKEWPDSIKQMRKDEALSDVA